MALTSRELASIILLVVFITMVIGLSRDRRDIAQSFAAVVKAAASWKILLPLAFYLAWTTLVVAVAYYLGLWSLDLLKDTAIIILFVGVPLVFNAVQFQGAADIFRRVFKNALGITALLVVYLNLALFPLWGELILQLVVIVLILLATGVTHDRRTASFGRAPSVLIGLVAVFLIVNVAVQVSQHFGEYDWSIQLETVVLSLWLPVTLIPFVYWFGFFAASEMALVRIRLHSRDQTIRLRVRLALVLGFHGSLGYAARFKMQWISRMAGEASFRRALRTMREYRRTVRTNRRAEKRRQERLEELAGIAGFDGDRLWIDRREFHDTKDVLTTLFFNQMGWYRNRHHRFQSDPDRVVPSVERTGLSEDHGIQLQVRKDGQSWIGWRLTVGGYCFAVGGTKTREDQWQYDGEKPPVDYPGTDSPGWLNVTFDESSAEWAVNDRPISDV